MAVVLDIEKIQNLVSIDKDEKIRHYCALRQQKCAELEEALQSENLD